MHPALHPSILDELRARIARIQHAGRPTHAVLPFGVPALDRHLPQGGLALGAVHQVTDAPQSAAAPLFIGGILARLDGTVLWCLRSRDLFAPALAGVGLHPDRVIYAEPDDDPGVLLCLEEGLRQPGLAAVVGEVARLPMTASRRLQLAAEASGVPAFILRRWRLAADAAEFAQPSAAVTSWRIASVPSAPLPVPGIGRARWRVELVRSRGGATAVWDMEACDAEGCLALSTDLADRSVASASSRAA
ncbi:MAG: damage-inducible protein [Acetobacteraceae bacterium]|nr:damage-inducible protein [Acetobacteraceae bacterium]